MERKFIKIGATNKESQEVDFKDIPLNEPVFFDLGSKLFLVRKISKPKLVS